MGIPTTLGRFAVKEQASGWGTAETSFVNANFVEAQISVPTPTQSSVQAEVMRASWFSTTRVAGGKGPVEVSLTMPLHGFSTDAPTTYPSEHPDSLLLRSVLGSSTQFGYATDPTGGSNDELTVTSAEAAICGLAVMPPMATSGDYSIGWVQDKTTTTYTMQRKWALTSAGVEHRGPSTGPTRYSSQPRSPLPLRSSGWVRPRM